jgi:acyl-CoA synthetase (AMP-forming)/AMP-acid ligase II
LTETGGGGTRTLGPEERRQLASAGRLSENMEAKIVNPETGEALGLGQRGELSLRGPTVMKGSDHGLKMIFFLKYIKIIL